MNALYFEQCIIVCIVSLYNLLLCILLLYNHCNDFAPCGTLIGIKISLSSCMSRQPVTLIPLLGTCHSDTMPWAWHRLTGQSVISLTLGFRKNFLSIYMLISSQALSKVFWKFQIWPLVHSDAYFGISFSIPDIRPWFSTNTFF